MEAKNNSTEYAVVIGGINIDIAAIANKKLLEKDSNPGHIQISMGGVGRNIADNLTKLGITTKLISIIGDDQYGKLICQSCNEIGIDISISNITSKAQTSFYVSIMDQHGRLKTAISDMAIFEFLLPAHLESHNKIMEKANAIVVDTNLRNDVIEYLLNKYQGRIIIDTVSTAKAIKIQDLFSKIHTIKTNRWEAQVLSGINLAEKKNILTAVQYFLDQGVTQVFITLGKDGVAYGSTDFQGIYKPKTVKAVNETGSGDAFSAGLAYCFGNNLDIKKTVEFACFAAAVAVESVESVNPEMSIAKINHLLNSNE